MARAVGSQPASVRLIAGCHATLLRPGMLHQPEHGEARQSREKWCCNGAAQSSSEACTMLRWRLITPLVAAGKPQLGPSRPAPLLFPSAPREVLHPPCPSLQLSHGVSPPAQSSRGLMLQPRAEALVGSHRLDPLARSLCPSCAEQMKTPARVRGKSKPPARL